MTTQNKTRENLKNVQSKSREKALKKRILTNLKDTQPNNPMLYKIWDLTLFALIVILVFVGSFGIGFFWWDARQSSRFLELSGEGFWSIFSDLLFEVILLVGILSLVSYFLYRKSDFWLVKKRLWLMIAFWVLVISIGGSFTILAENQKDVENQYQNTQQNITKIPFRPKRRIDQIQEKRNEEGLFTGRVIDLKEVQQNEFKITIRNPKFRKSFLVKNEQIQDVKRGDFVEVKVDPKNPEKVIEIRELNPPRNLFLKPKIIQVNVKKSGFFFYQIDCGVVSDAVKPAGEFEVGFEAGNAFVGFEKSFAGDIFSILLVKI